MTAMELRHGIVGTLDRFTMWHFGEVVATVEHSRDGDWIVETPEGSHYRFPSRPLAVRCCSSLAGARDVRVG